MFFAPTKTAGTGFFSLQIGQPSLQKEKAFKRQTAWKLWRQVVFTTSGFFRNFRSAGQTLWLVCKSNGERQMGHASSSAGSCWSCCCCSSRFCCSSFFRKFLACFWSVGVYGTAQSPPQWWGYAAFALQGICMVVYVIIEAAIRAARDGRLMLFSNFLSAIRAARDGRLS